MQGISEILFVVCFIVVTSLYIFSFSLVQTNKNFKKLQVQLNTIQLQTADVNWKDQKIKDLTADINWEDKGVKHIIRDITLKQKVDFRG